MSNLHMVELFLGEETIIEKIPIEDWSVGKLMVHFHGRRLLWKISAHSSKCYPCVDVLIAIRRHSD